MERYNCPKCPDEEMVQVVGNIATCRSCDIVLVESPEPGQIKLPVIVETNAQTSIED